MREVDHGVPAPRHLFHQEKMTVEAGTQIEDDRQGILGQHLLDLLTQGQCPRRSCPIRWKRYRGASEGRRRILEGDAVSIPQDGQHPGLSSKSLPVPPVRPTGNPPSTERDPIRRTFSRPLFACYRSCRKPMKRAPYPCVTAASDPAG